MTSLRALFTFFLMSLKGKSLLNIHDMTDEEIQSCFQRAFAFKKEFEAKGEYSHLVETPGLSSKVLAVLFFEPSTRSRLSFQIAAFRMGVRTLVMDSIMTSSISKGESHVETLANVAAMKPDMIVVRYGDVTGMDTFISEIGIPVINAGSGTMEHPTQALLDAMTIIEARGKIKGEKVLIVGDVLHSRVANSNLKLLKRLGAEIAICAPQAVRPNQGEWESIHNFAELDEAMEWCSVCMGLRIQTERHKGQGLGLTLADYRHSYRLDAARLTKLVDDGVVMHPGPFVEGVDLSTEVLKDPRCKIRDQVTNGVFIRAAIMSLIFGVEVSQG